MAKNFTPHAGDIVWLDFDPQAGHEQSRRRPALVLSPKIYNEKSSLALVCPISHVQKGYPFEVILLGKKVAGTILSDQVKSMDWKARNAVLIEKCPPAILSEVKNMALKLIN